MGYKEKIIEKYDLQEYVQPEIEIPDFSDKEGIIVLCGSSGSGKSTILKTLGYTNNVEIDYTKDLIDNFSTPEEAEKLMISTGLRSIPTWFRSADRISNGEKHRFEVALSLDKSINFIDEFTSIVDRSTAKSLSSSIKKYFDKGAVKTLYIATPHSDVIEWLLPNHVYDTDHKVFLKDLPLQRPKIDIIIETATKQDWILFGKHHYLDTELKGGMHCYVAIVDGHKVGFMGIMHGTGRDIKTYWRESRLVVLPEWQGLGIGKSMSDQLAREYTSRGLRYFSKTAHPAMGIYRDNSPAWRGTSTNHKKRTSYIKQDGTARKAKGFGKTAKSIARDANRVTYSHEYMGEPQCH